MKTHFPRYREAMYAGIFYPEDPVMLRGLVNTALEDAPPRRDTARGLLVPHASYDYILELLASGWKSASGRAGQIETIVFLADDTQPGKPAIIIPESDYFETPLGQIEVCRRCCEEAEAGSTVVVVDDICHMNNHSIEVQLPFVQILYPGTAIMPILIRGVQPNIAAIAARLLDLILTERPDSTLLAVCSNLASSLVPHRADQLADLILDSLNGNVPEALFSARVEHANISVGSMSAFLLYNRYSRLNFELFCRADSRSLRGSNAEHIVHYASAGWYQ